MLTTTIGAGKKANSLMQEYSLLLGDAMLLHRARSAEQTARIEAELANRVKQEFISNMSHELRTPLNTVIGFARLLADQARLKASDAKVADYGNLIVASAEHLLSVINDILDISKIQSGRYTINSQEVRIDELLQQAIADHGEEARAAKVSIRARLGGAAITVRGDASKLRQALDNLLDNAIKFTLPGGNIEIVAATSKEGGALVNIRDTGIGMSADEVRVAMTPFGQVDASRSRWREGAGLGLPIAKALIGLHGGNLAIDSAKGIGTDVIISLPSPSAVSGIQRAAPTPMAAAQAS